MANSTTVDQKIYQFSNVVLPALCFFAALFLSTQPSSARELNYCSTYYTDISVIHYAVEALNPESQRGLDLAEIESDIQNTIDKVLHGHVADGRRIPIHKATDSIESTLAKDPLALYLTIRIFHVPANAFQPPLPDEETLFAVRAATSRLNRTSASEARTRLQTTQLPYKFFFLSKTEQTDIFGHPVRGDVSALAHQVACKILPYFARNMCINPDSLDYAVAPITIDCKPAPTSLLKEHEDWESRKIHPQHGDTHD